MFTKHIHSVNLLFLHDRFLANQTFVTIQFCYWLNRKLKLLCLSSNLGEKNTAQGSLSKTCNVLLSWVKDTMGSDQHALYQTQCIHCNVCIFLLLPLYLTMQLIFALWLSLSFMGCMAHQLGMYLFSRSTVFLTLFKRGGGVKPMLKNTDFVSHFDLKLR